MSRDSLIDEACRATSTRFGSTFYSELERCPKSATLRYRRGITPTEPNEPQLIGSLVHATLAYAGLRVIAGLRPDRDGWPDVIDAYIEKLESFDLIIDPGPVNKAIQLIGTYWSHWGYDNAGYPADGTLLDVEQSFELWVSEEYGATLEQPEDGTRAYRVTGTFDAVLETRKCKIVIFDHKTRASLSKRITPTEYGHLASRRAQYIAMCAAVKLMTGKAPTFVDNLLVKTRIPQYARFPFQASDDLITAWAVHQARAREAYERDPDRMSFSACSPPIGGTCWAFDYCHGTPEQRQKMFAVGTAAQPDLPVARLTQPRR